jgi:predicted transport protein
MEFQWLVMERLGAETAKQVDWSAPRLLCIAGDFTRYDEHAVKQIARNIELIRYRRFDGNLLLLELVHAPKQARPTPTTPQREDAADRSSGNTEAAESEAAVYLSQQIAYRISQSDPALRDLFEAIRQFLLGLGDDVQMKELKYYVAFKRLKNFACLEVYPQARVVTMHLKVDPGSVELEEGFSRDVTEIGHFGTGDLQLSLRTMDDFAKAQPLIRRSYEGS